MKCLLRIFRTACLAGFVSISINSLDVTLGADLIQPPGTLAAQLGGPSYELPTGWQGFNVFGIAVQVNLGGDIGGTAASVSMSGSGDLQFSQYPGNGSLTLDRK